MKDQRIVLGAAFGFEYFGNGSFLQSIGAKAVDGFCWKGNQAASADDFRCRFCTVGSVSGQVKGLHSITLNTT